MKHGGAVRICIQQLMEGIYWNSASQQHRKHAFRVLSFSCHGTQSYYYTISKPPLLLYKICVVYVACVLYKYCLWYAREWREYEKDVPLQQVIRPSCILIGSSIEKYSCLASIHLTPTDRDTYKRLLTNFKSYWTQYQTDAQQLTLWPTFTSTFTCPILFLAKTAHHRQSPPPHAACRQTKLWFVYYLVFGGYLLNSIISLSILPSVVVAAYCVRWFRNKENIKNDCCYYVRVMWVWCIKASRARGCRPTTTTRPYTAYIPFHSINEFIETGVWGMRSVEVWGQ